LPLLAAFLCKDSLWLVTMYASAGSLLSIMQYAHPQVRPPLSLPLPHVPAFRPA
jgi:hypothetical protein